MSEFARLSLGIPEDIKAGEAKQEQMTLMRAKKILQDDRRKKAQTALVTNIMNDEQKEARLREQGRMGERRLQEQRKKTA